MRADSMAAKLLGNDVTGFWKEVRALNRGSTSLPNNIGGVSGETNIAELWRQHYSGIFNCVSSDPYKVNIIDYSASAGISVSEVYKAITQLADNKSCGPDHISAEHLKLAGPRVAALLAICFSGFMVLYQNLCWLLHLYPLLRTRRGRWGVWIIIDQ